MFRTCAGLLTAAVLSASLFLAACPGEGAASSGDQPFTIRIAGDRGQSFSGSYVLMKADGNIVTEAFEGTAPRDFRAEGLQIDVTIQKTTPMGYLEVQLLRGREVVDEDSVTAAFGSTTLSGR